jgi:hypothetical protein
LRHLKVFYTAFEHGVNCRDENDLICLIIGFIVKYESEAFYDFIEELALNRAQGG